MGKLQIRGGSGTVPPLSPREPYFDGENLHVGKLDGSGNKVIGGGGTSEPVFNPIMLGFDAIVYAIAVTPAGDIFVGGSGLFRKFNHLGIEDASFSSDLITSEISSMCAISDGVLVGHYSGNYIDKIDFDGIVDESFAITASAPVLGIAVDDEGAIYVSDYSETVKKYVAGVEDETFQFPFTGLCRDLLFHNGYLYAVMYNEGYGIVSRMTKTAVEDLNFFIGPLDGSIWRMGILNDNIFIGGHFTEYIKKYSLDGMLDEEFSCNVVAPIYGIAILGSNLLIGGQITQGDEASVLLIDQQGEGVMNDIQQVVDWNPGDLIMRNRLGQFVRIPAPTHGSEATLMHSGQVNTLPYWSTPPIN